MKPRILAALPIVALACAAPSLSQAMGLYHPGNGEISFTYHPDHVRSTTTRAEVLADLEAARRDGTLRFFQLALPVPKLASQPRKTREQVIAELRNESPEERQARFELYRGG